ncbi:MAG TPA: hypothetical protein VGQ83_17930 [Polyangia bacterium]|jgi:hypothetical protein
MPGWQVAVIVLIAVFVGMWIPVSLQLMQTLRSGQRFLDTMGTRGGRTLAELTDTIKGLNDAVGGVGELAHSASQLKDSIRLISSIGAAVGPAVVAAVRALREPDLQEEERPGAGGEALTAAGPGPVPLRKENHHGA